MKLIIESGATKSDWVVVSDAGQQVARLSASGMNISSMPFSAIEATIADACRRLKGQNIAVEALYMYTAGVVTESIRTSLTQTFRGHFCGAEVEILDDMTAAVRATCGHSAGIVAIVGTGSNSCLFDGEKIVKKVYSGGFILGDEGSAAALGRMFVADLLKGLIPKYIADDFTARYGYDYAAIVERVYHSTSPAAFLGSLAPFILEYYDDDYIRRYLRGIHNAQTTTRACALKQYDVASFPIGVVGGFGNALKDIFTRVAEQEGVTISRFVSAPIEELIKYHTI